MLVSQFGSIKKKEDDTISMFNTKLKNIVNQVYQLREEIFRCEACQEIPEIIRGFDAQVVAIEEAHDTFTMRLDEMM